MIGFAVLALIAAGAIMGLVMGLTGDPNVSVSLAGAIFQQLGFGIAASNTWGLFLLIILLGYGLVELPRSLWHASSHAMQLRHSQFRAAALQSKRDDARENLPAAIARVQYRIDTEGLPVKWRNDALARRGLLEFRNEDLEACERSLRAWRELPAEDRTDNANFTMSVDNVLAAAMGRRGAFAEAAAMMAESCRTMPTLEWTRNVVVKRDGVALALERGVAFYLAWHAVDPDGGHDAEAAAVQEQLAAWRAGVR